MSRSFRHTPVIKESGPRNTNKKAKTSWHRRLRRQVHQRLKQDPYQDLPDGRQFVNRWWFVGKYWASEVSKKFLSK